MATIYMLEAVNLFMGDHDPSASNHLELESLKLPEPSFKTIEHTPGGGVMGVEFVTTLLEAQTVTFKLVGMNPERLKLFGLNTPYRSIYTAYGVVRDVRTNREREAKAIIEARLAKMTPDEAKRGEAFGHDYELKEIVSYSLSIGDQPIFEVDFFKNTHSVGGVDQFANKNRILRVPGAA